MVLIQKIITYQTKVATIDPEDPKSLLIYYQPFRNNLGTPGNSSGATITIETDTVSGTSPYIFNISLRSVFSMQYARRWKQSRWIPFNGCGNQFTAVLFKKMIELC